MPKPFAAPQGPASSVPHPEQAHDLTMITLFQPGHGWTATNASASDLNDTSDFVLGKQSAKFTHPAGGVPAWIDRRGLSLDLRSKVLRLWLKVEGDLSGLGDITFYAGDAHFANFFSWVIEHSPTPEDQILPTGGGWVVVDLGFGDAATTGLPDRGAVERLRLRVNAPKGGPTTLHANGVACYPEPEPWPDGVVSITFDDSLEDQYTTSRPILDAYGFPATAYIIRDRIGRPGRLTLDQLHRLEDYSGWEVAGHSDLLANHNAMWTHITPSALAEDSARLQDFLRSEGFRGVNHCAYPSGAYDDSVLAVVRQYWRAARTIVQATTEVTRPPNPLTLRAWSVARLDPYPGVIDRLDAAKAGKQWCILGFHHVVPTPAASTEYAIRGFEAILEHIRSLGMPVRLVSDVLRI